MLADFPFNGEYSQTAHVIAVQLNMADRAWIPEVGRKPVAVPRHFTQSKSLLLQWLFSLHLVAQ